MLDTIWLEARRLLRREMPEKDFEAWIEPLRATRWAGGQLTLEAPSVFFRDWLKRNFLGALERAVAEARGGSATVVVQVNRALDVPSRRPPMADRPTPAPAVPPPAGRYTFDNFVVGASNQVAYGAARAVVAQPGARFNPLFLFGGVGLGKTHLLSAVAHGLAVERGRRVAYLSAENFLNEMIVALERRRMERFRQRFRGIETLIMDDIQFLAGKRRSQEEFCHTFNALHDGRKQIVIASDRAPHEMPGIEETLRNRFASGLLTQIESPDPALRLALVRSKAAALGVVLEPEVATCLADRCCTNVRELEGVLTRLEAVSSLAGRTIDLALVEELLGPRPRKGRSTLERIIGEVCAQFHVSPAELTSTRRTARIAVPRQLVMFLCREHTDAPLNAIGARLGGRDHSTVAHALGAIQRRLQKDAEFRRVVSALRMRLGA